MCFDLTAGPGLPYGWPPADELVVAAAWGRLASRVRVQRAFSRADVCVARASRTRAAERAGARQVWQQQRGAAGRDLEDRRDMGVLYNRVVHRVADPHCDHAAPVFHRQASVAVT